MKKHFRHEQYKEAVLEKHTFRHGMDVLPSGRHRIYGNILTRPRSHPSTPSAGSQHLGLTLWLKGKGMRSPRDAAGMDAYIEELFNA